MKVSFKNKAGEKLAGILEGNSDNAVIVCHGFTDNKNSSLVSSIAESLKASFTVLRFDFSGNGESEGSFADCSYSKQVSDIASAVEFLKSRGCETVSLAGHSMGGSSCILASVDLPVASVVSVAAPVFINLSRLKELSERYSGNHVSEDFVEDLLNASIIKASEKRVAPLLIAHGMTDKLISIQEAMELFNHAHEPKEYFFAPDADHHFTGKENLLVEKIKIWIEHWIS